MTLKRTLLATTICSLACVTACEPTQQPTTLKSTAYKSSTTPSKTSANNFYEHFPTNIPGIEKIGKDGPNNPDRVLVIIGQRHPDYINFGSLERKLEDLRRKKIFSNETMKKRYIVQTRRRAQRHAKAVIENQKNIALAMCYLRDEYGVNEFRVEGFEGGSWALHSKKEVMRAKLFCKDYEVDTPDWKYFAGATVVLGGQENITIKPAEDAKLYAYCNKMLHNNKIHNALATGIIDAETGPIIRGVYLDGRENALLRMINKDDEPSSVVIFSSSPKHDFTNNIKEWNLVHPKNQFAQIILSPK